MKSHITCHRAGLKKACAGKLNHRDRLSELSRKLKMKFFS
ncbi:Uncharacterized protein dnm_061860 [Desulfonema magnum]|uniref:Uncharacterized protein n=1 Tax=Desulfonema magnum TaxID=45655 RepID=A0A975BR97_9BACT|nr:Uncharacterized protein dnm_061860 [Desulfonema magnum]